MKRMDNSEINGIGTFHTAFQVLFHTQLTGHSIGDKEGWQKMTNYQNSLASFTMKNQFQNNRYLCVHLLTFVKFHELRLKGNPLTLQTNIQYDHQSEIKGLVTLHAVFPALYRT